MTGQRAYGILEVDSNGKEQGLQTFHGELSTHGSQRIEWHDNRSDEHGFLTHVNMWNIVEHCGIVYDDIANIGWLVVDLPLWKILVSWDDDIPNMWKNNSHVPNHHPVGLDKIYHNSPTFFQVFHGASYPNPTIGPMAQVTNKPRHLGSQMSTGLDVLIHEAAIAVVNFPIKHGDFP